MEEEEKMWLHVPDEEKEHLLKLITGLFHAVFRDKLECVELIAREAERRNFLNIVLNWGRINGLTPLMTAASLCFSNIRWRGENVA